MQGAPFRHKTVNTIGPLTACCWVTHIIDMPPFPLQLKGKKAPCQPCYLLGVTHSKRKFTQAPGHNMIHKLSSTPNTIITGNTTHPFKGH